MLAYCETVAMVTLWLVPAAYGALRYFTAWFQPTNMQLIAGVAVWLLWQRFVASGYAFGLRSVARLQGRGNGKVAIVTGANTGIGFETAVALSESGAKVIVTCRDAAKVTSTIEAIKARLSASRRATAELQGFTMELDSQASVRRCAAEIIASGAPIHILVNNAGGMFTPGPDGKLPRTVEGHELNLGANFAAVVLFTDLLMSRLSATRGRVVLLSSRAPDLVGVTPAGMRKIMKGHPTLTHLEAGGSQAGGLLYGASKLGNCYHASFAARENPAVEFVSLHPGIVATEFLRFARSWLLMKIYNSFTLLLMKTPFEGALTTVHCALAPKVVNGAYYADETIAGWTAVRRDRGLEAEVMAFGRSLTM